MTNEMIKSFWNSVDSVKNGMDVCWDTVMWDMFFEYPEMENDNQLVRELYDLIDSIETQLCS